MRLNNEHLTATQKLRVHIHPDSCLKRPKAESYQKIFKEIQEKYPKPLENNMKKPEFSPISSKPKPTIVSAEFQSKLLTLLEKTDIKKPVSISPTLKPNENPTASSPQNQSKSSSNPPISDTIKSNKIPEIIEIHDSVPKKQENKSKTPPKIKAFLPEKHEILPSKIPAQIPTEKISEKLTKNFEGTQQKIREVIKELEKNEDCKLVESPPEEARKHWKKSESGSRQNSHEKSESERERSNEFQREEKFEYRRSSRNCKEDEKRPGCYGKYYAEDKNIRKNSRDSYDRNGYVKRKEYEKPKDAYRYKEYAPRQNYENSQYFISKLINFSEYSSHKYREFRPESPKNHSRRYSRSRSKERALAYTSQHYSK